MLKDEGIAFKVKKGKGINDQYCKYFNQTSEIQECESPESVNLILEMHFYHDVKHRSEQHTIEKMKILQGYHLNIKY